MLSPEQFKGLHKDLMGGGPESEGGFSVNVGTGERLGSGDPAFVVSHPGSEETIPQKVVSPPHLGAYASRHAQALSGPDDLMGGWKPPASQDANVYLDHSQALRYSPQHSNPRLDVAHANTLTSAMDLAHARNQISVYNAREGKVHDNPSYRPPK